MSEIEKYYNGKIHIDFEEDDLIGEIIEQHNEIERLKSIIKGLDNTIENLEEVVEHEENIIKEVREHIEKTIEYEKSCGFNRWTYEDGQETYIDMVEKTLDILDKGDKENI